MVAKKSSKIDRSRLATSVHGFVLAVARVRARARARARADRSIDRAIVSSRYGRSPRFGPSDCSGDL